MKLTFLFNQKSAFSRCSSKQTNKGMVGLTLPNHFLLFVPKGCFENHCPSLQQMMMKLRFFWSPRKKLVTFRGNFPSPLVADPTRAIKN